VANQILKEHKMAHQKHAKLTKPTGGKYGRLEIGLMGAPCGEIKKLAGEIINKLTGHNISYLDADHHAEESTNFSALKHGATSQLTNKISHYALELMHGEDHYFNDADMVLINGNHFRAQEQIAWIHPKKSLEKKLERLTNVKLVLLEEGAELPLYLEDHLAGKDYNILPSTDLENIVAYFEASLEKSKPEINGLVLVGGKSTRMQQDKSKLVIRDNKPQFSYLADLLKEHCKEVYVSVRDENQAGEFELPAITDKFIGLGPYGGILSAFMENPNAAWFVVAVDLPFLDNQAIAKLVEERDSGKVATCYIDRKNEFPEPLITIWEPRAYPILLNFLSRGHSCPRKTLINSDVKVINEREESILTNVNNPEDLLAAKSTLK
jgi:molybdopterin-guanine dinucleotide biosynthesis protein A